jgi:anion-transporting  ArsA/GET3 family ATPase
VFLDKRLVIVTGKGGVGKSAVSAGIALLAQRRGLRVLAIEMGSLGGLSAHFSTGPLKFKPLEVKPGLHAMGMVRSEALLEYLSLQLRLPGMSRFGPFARAFDALATAAPAIREIITIGKVLWEVKADRWDLVVADAPPTGQIGSYLRAPRSISELVPTGRIRQQSEWMQEALKNPDDTSLMIVNLPEELPTTETLQTIGWLDAEQLVPEPVIVTNRVLPQISDPSSPDGVVGEMVQLHRSLWSEQQHWLGRIDDNLRLPYMFGLFTPGEVAARMSDELEALR